MLHIFKQYGQSGLFVLSEGNGQVGFDEFVTLLGPKLTTTGMPDKFHGTDFDSVFWKVWIAASLKTDTCYVSVIYIMHQFCFIVIDYDSL